MIVMLVSVIWLVCNIIVDGVARCGLGEVSPQNVALWNMMMMMMMMMMMKLPILLCAEKLES